MNTDKFHTITMRLTIDQYVMLELLSATTRRSKAEIVRIAVEHEYEREINKSKIAATDNNDIF